MSTVADKTRIRLLNDAFRSTFLGGKVVMTQGVDTLPAVRKAEVLSKVQAFADFNGENDPHGEHDFGSFDVAGQTYFFKVDYYAPDMEGGSEDPADPDKTTRVLTIMRANEYCPPFTWVFCFGCRAIIDSRERCKSSIVAGKQLQPVYGPGLAMRCLTTGAAESTPMQQPANLVPAIIPVAAKLAAVQFEMTTVSK
jgi:hypothetical protein